MRGALYETHLHGIRSVKEDVIHGIDTGHKDEDPPRNLRINGLEVANAEHLDSSVYCSLDSEGDLRIARTTRLSLTFRSVGKVFRGASINRWGHRMPRGT
jgi:hypothetical protein